jgi:hypothetical protein
MSFGLAVSNMFLEYGWQSSYHPFSPGCCHDYRLLLTLLGFPLRRFSSDDKSRKDLLLSSLIEALVTLQVEREFSSDDISKGDLLISAHPPTLLIVQRVQGIYKEEICWGWKYSS